jgi:hypothetical protein
MKYIIYDISAIVSMYTYTYFNLLDILVFLYWKLSIYVYIFYKDNK